MNAKKMTFENIAKIDGIISEINAVKFRMSRSDYKPIDYDKKSRLIISLLKVFYGPEINEGIFAAILRDSSLCSELEKIFFENLDFLKLCRVDNCYWLFCGGDKRVFNSSVFGNYIYLDDIKVQLRLSSDELLISFNSNLSQSYTERLLFDKDGLVSRREISKKISPIKINGVEGYGCRSTVVIERDVDDPCLVEISDVLEMKQQESLTTMPVRRVSGYIHPVFLFDLSSVFKLEDSYREYAIERDSCFRTDGMIDRHFPNIKRAFVARMKKNKGFSRKRKNNV